MLNSDDLAFFDTVATSRSLADAARRLDVTPSAVTQRLRGLETRLGVRLADRSGRRLTLTDAGRLVAVHGEIVAGSIAALAEALRDQSDVVSGHLRIAAPSGFGRAHVAPVAREFARAHPRTTLTLDLSDNPLAQLADHYDVVVHIGSPPPLDATVTTLAENRRVLCASPDYLEGAAPIRLPGDLHDHCCLILRENMEDVTLWRFSREQEQVTVRIHPKMSTNDGTILREWVRSGLGITVRSEWDIADDLRIGRLRAVLPDWNLASADVIAIMGARRGRSARSSVFLDMLRHALSPSPWRLHAS